MVGGFCAAAVQGDYGGGYGWSDGTWMSRHSDGGMMQWHETSPAGASCEFHEEALGRDHVARHQTLDVLSHLANEVI